MKDELMIEALLTEYREMRAEIRDTVNALDRNLYTGVVMISGLIALASLLHDSKILMFVPTIMLVVGFIHLAKTSSASILGTYCQIIADTLKSHLGKDNIVYDWEGGELCSRLAHPFGVVQVNLCFIYVGMSVAFWCALLHAYHIGKTPIIIHAVGYIIWVIFAIKASWYNTLKFRNTYIRKYMANKNIQRTGQNAADDV